MPAGVATVIGPVDAPVGTCTTTWVAVFDAIGVLIPLNATAVAVPRLSPVIVTDEANGPDVGVNDVIAGVTEVVMRPTELFP